MSRYVPPTPPQKETKEQPKSLAPVSYTVEELQLTTEPQKVWEYFFPASGVVVSGGIRIDKIQPADNTVLLEMTDDSGGGNVISLSKGMNSLPQAIPVVMGTKVTFTIRSTEPTTVKGFSIAFAYEIKANA